MPSPSRSTGRRCCAGVGAWDTAEAQTVPLLAGTMHPTGFPAYVVVGWLASQVLAPLGEPAYRMNLLSAILAAVAAGDDRRDRAPARRPHADRRRRRRSASRSRRSPGGSRPPPTSTRSTSRCSRVLVLALVRWERLVDAGDGTAAALRSRPRARRRPCSAWRSRNHALTLLLVPAIGAYVLVVDRAVLHRRRTVVAALGAAVGVAALLYLQLPFSAGVVGAPLVYGHPDTLPGFLGVVLARQFQGDFAATLASLADAVPALARLAVAQLGPLAILVLPAFVVTAIRRPAYADAVRSRGGRHVRVRRRLRQCRHRPLLPRARAVRWTWLAILGGAAVDLVAARLGRAAIARRRRRRHPRALSPSPSAACCSCPPGGRCPDTRRPWTDRTTRRWHTGSTTP